jgi:hypothetical protein
LFFQKKGAETLSAIALHLFSRDKRSYDAWGLRQMVFKTCGVQTMGFNLAFGWGHVCRLLGRMIL